MAWKGGVGMKWFKNLIIGRARNLGDAGLFHKVSLVALLAWVGLGADGLSSSCYGPEEAFKALGSHPVLAIFVGLATVVTITVVCISYSQIIELFPGGGGGYLVASKLLSPGFGVVSGCALLVDYVLTIALSISSGADALFSILPAEWQGVKLPVALGAAALLTLMNLRGVKESVLFWTPVFVLFILTHGFGILYAIGSHLGTLPLVAAEIKSDLNLSVSQLGWFGLLALLVRAYGVGAGTYTGIEAVSNGLPILREPRVATGKRTMLYMGVSLSLTVGGLLLAYVLYHVKPVSGKTLNAVLFEGITSGWPAGLGPWFVGAAMISAALLLFVAAQTGFLDGPRVIANMALDHWFPQQFAQLSDRLVVQNGILLMGIAALVAIALAGGSVAFLVVLYSINVFITFSLSQLGMVRHWWTSRASENRWRRKLIVNGVGLCLTGFILITLCIAKFREGGWVTLAVTGGVVGVAVLVGRYYQGARFKLKRLDEAVLVLEQDGSREAALAAGKPSPICYPKEHTAVVLVNGFNGLGVHTLMKITTTFPGVFKNYVFAHVGVVDAGNFKGTAEIEELRRHIKHEASRYADYMMANGYYAEAVTCIGTDVVETADKMVDEIASRFPRAVFFGGQLLFLKETWMTRFLHNFVIFSLQRMVFRKGFPFVMVPIRM